MKMSLDYYDVALPALKFICGESEHICRLCFTSTDDQELCLQDTINVQRSFLVETISFSDVFDYLGIIKDAQLPQVLCVDCATVAVNCYIFRRLCQYSEQKWNDIINKVEEGLVKSESLNATQQVLYLVIENGEVLTYSSRKKCKTKTRKSTIEKLKIIIKGRKSYLRNKETVTLICCECGKEFTSKIDLAKHMRKHKIDSEENLKYPCKNCAKIFRTSTSLYEHVERVHYTKKIQCPKCSEMVSTEKMLSVHERTHHVPAACSRCRLQFPSRAALRAHLNKHEAHACPRCRKVFYNKQTFRFHVKICGNDEMKKHIFFCDICNKGYARKFSIRAHLKIHHGFGKVISCNWCGKKFDAKSKLNNHIVKHTKERNYECTMCKGKFVTQAALVYHTRLHTGERPFPCDLCADTFLSASRRMEHKRRKHFAPSKQCDLCHMKFTTNNQLKKHMERHFNPRSKLFTPHACKLNLSEIGNDFSVYEA